jgi:DNA recombination protein RmuC
LAAQFYLLLILVAGVAVASGWLYRGRRDAAIIDRLQADLGQYKVREAVLEERGLRVDEVQARYVECNEQLQAARSEAAQLATALEVASSELKSQQVLASEKQQLLRLNQLEFRQQFELHARKNLEGCNDRLAAMAEDRLNSLLVPLREQLGDFKRRVEETYDRDSQDRHQLKAEIAQLKTLNERISNDAINLTNALRGNNKSLGTWGELVLERVLESAGLVKDRDYEREVSFQSESGRRLRPDVLIHLPGGRDVIIDAKVSIKAFEKAHAERTDKAARNRWMRLHVKSIRTHIETLSVKEYERIDAVNSLDFVILFVPVEAAFQAAVEFDGGLYKDAFDRDVVLVGPASLMVTCRTIQNVWRTEMQHRNALQIARKAGDLIDKFIAFTRDLDKVGESLSVASNAYDQARRRLSSGRGNLMSRAKTIQQLGAIGKEQV